MFRLSLFLIAGMMLFGACRSQSAPADPASAEIAQWSGQQGGGESAKTRVLRTAEEWNGFWRQVEGERPRPLNESREMAVVVELGTKRTGGYTAVILGARVQEGKFVVDYRETAPEPGMMVTQAITSPWVAGIVPRTDLPVVFHDGGAPPQARREK